MFKSVSKSREIVRFTYNDTPVEACAGDSVAAALLKAGYVTLRKTAVSGSPRGPLCMMGVCFECLVVLEGAGSRQACMVPAEDGISVRSHDGRPALPA